MKPPAPGPVSGDSATNDISTAATAASTALPPSRRTSAAASAVSGCPAATTPLMPRAAYGAAGTLTASGSAARYELRYLKVVQGAADALAPRRAGDPRLVVGVLG